MLRTVREHSLGFLAITRTRRTEERIGRLTLLNSLNEVQTNSTNSTISRDRTLIASFSRDRVPRERMKYP
jgi:hypothetical protein